jgi:hypothetical protein
VAAPPGVGGFLGGGGGGGGGVAKQPGLRVPPRGATADGSTKRPGCTALPQPVWMSHC